MATTTDFSRSPYFDDFKDTKNFYKILYRPGVPVQTRELNQMQSILQDQINKFGRHVFKEGTIIEGCSFTFDKNYTYVKIKDTYANGTAFTNIQDFIGSNIYNGVGLTAVIVNAVEGYESDGINLNTLYVKYKNSVLNNGINQSTFLPGENLSINLPVTANTLVGNVFVSTVTSNGSLNIGKGYGFTTTTGVIFQKGYFINVPNTSIIVSKYDNQPNNVSIGFNSVESIVTPEADTSLLDNAAGAPNYTAPGAHRFKLTPTLVTRTTSDIASTENFFSLVDFQSGVPTTIRDTAEYAALGAQMAKRTFETNGNFIVRPFMLSTEEKAPLDPEYTTHVNLVSSRGLGYVEGYRVEYLDNNKISLRKGTDYESNQQRVGVNYGNYYYVNQLVGDFKFETLQMVELHDVAKTAISSRLFLDNVSYSSSSKIGVAWVKSITYDSGTIGSGQDIYRLYLFNIKMNKGKSASNIKSIINYNSGVLGVADVILDYNPSLSAMSPVYTANLKDTQLGPLIYPFGQSAIKLDGFTSTGYTYKRTSSADFSSDNGQAVVNLPAVTGSATESFYYGGNPLPAFTASRFIVEPTSTVRTPTKPGTVTTVQNSKTVAGNPSTTFLVSYSRGDYICFSDNYNDIYYIDLIIDNHTLTLREAFVPSGASGLSHAKTFPKGTPINFTTGNRSISVVGSAATFSLGEPLNGDMSCKFVYDINRASTVAEKKQYVQNVFVKIDCSNNVNGYTGPWRLGLPDIVKINAVYIGDNQSYSTGGTDYSSSFSFNDGQTDSSYDLGYIGVNSASLLTATSTILVDMDVYTIQNGAFNGRSQGVGFFTANSYPVNDVDPTAGYIETAQIPVYFSSSNIRYDLRDCVDFRPYASNTAVLTTNYSSATVNPVEIVNYNVLPAGSFLPTPDTEWDSITQHYLPRKDLISIDINGKLQITEGTPSLTPVTPQPKAKTMTLGVAAISPYPSFVPKTAALYNRYDYSITTTIAQNKRYTMKDIGSLDSRITNLEYYTSLSLLEKATNDLLVKSDTTGLNRFKNGILVDPFKDHSIGNQEGYSSIYRISIEPTEHMRPFFRQFNKHFTFDPNRSTNVVQVGNLILLNYTEVSYINQPYASKYRNCADGNIYSYNATIILDPAYITNPDLAAKPEVPALLDLSSNWTALAGSAFGTSWNNWQTVSSTPVKTYGGNQLLSSTTDTAGNVINQYNQQVTTTTTNQEKRTGTQMSLSQTSDTKIDLGNFVQNINIITYMPSVPVKFSCYGMKPGARVYAFFDDKDVNMWCQPTDSSFSPTGQYNDALYVSTDGSIFGIFTIPPNRFRSTQLKFMLVDVPNLTTGVNDISSQATGILYSSNIQATTAEVQFTTRQPQLSFQEVKDARTTNSSQTDNFPTTEVINNPIVINNITNNAYLTENIQNITQDVTNITQQINNITQDITNITDITNIYNDNSVYNTYNTYTTPNTDSDQTPPKDSQDNVVYDGLPPSESDDASISWGTPNCGGGSGGSGE